jgi:1-acyl-sn-glycerol-3-phosphate acyltransferase
MIGKDIETTQQACAKFKHIPTSVMNFFEGTRLTPAKHQKQLSPHKHLLKPKSGGFAFALNAMGDKFQSLLDCTIVYPNGTPNFSDFMRGEIPEVIVRIREIPIPIEFCSGDYENDPKFKQKFQTWVSDIWLEKDQQIESLQQNTKVKNTSNHVNFI